MHLDTLCNSTPVSTAWSLATTVKCYHHAVTFSPLGGDVTTRDNVYQHVKSVRQRTGFIGRDGIFSAFKGGVGGQGVSPVHPGDAFLYDALDLLEHVGVFFIDPVSQVTTVIQDLMVSRVEEGGGKK